MVALLCIEEILHYIAIAYIGELPTTSTSGMLIKEMSRTPIQKLFLLFKLRIMGRLIKRDKLLLIGFELIEKFFCCMGGRHIVIIAHDKVAGYFKFRYKRWQRMFYNFLQQNL